jgi:hypothetical protein
MRHCVIIIYIVLFLVSCTSDYNESWHIIGEFPPPVMLTGVPVMGNESGILSIYAGYSYIIISTIRDTIFNVYDKNIEYLGGFGQQGEGPYEFPQIGLINDIVKEGDGYVAFAIDLIRNKKYGIDISSTLISDELIVKYEYELPWDLSGAYLFYRINEDIIIGTYRDHYYQRLDGKYGLFYYYPKSNSFETTQLYNLDIFTKDRQPVNDPSARMNINAHASVISPDRSKIAILMFYTPRLEVFTIGDHQPKRFLLQTEPQKEDFDLISFYEGNIVKHYNHIQATDRFIYMLYSGRTEPIDGTEPSETYIKVIDWEGTPHYQYNIPADYDITIFSVDEENKTFYGLSHSKDAIYKFDYSSKESELSF